MESVYFVLLPGHHAQPRSLPEAIALFRGSDRARAVMLGGANTTFSVRLRDVSAGIYTLCVVPSAPPHPNAAAASATLEARYEVEVAEKSATHFASFIARIKREAGFRTLPADFSGSVVHTYPIEITDAPSSRLVTLA